MAIAAAVMGLALWAGNSIFEANLGVGLWHRIMLLGALVGGGIVIYGLAIFATGAYRLSEFKALVRPGKNI
jgi:putative peptidoglycan lipid II flippase